MSKLPTWQEMRGIYKRPRISQKIYALRLTDEEARALLALSEVRCDRTLGRIYRRLEKIMDQIGGD